LNQDVWQGRAAPDGFCWLVEDGDGYLRTCFTPKDLFNIHGQDRLPDVRTPTAECGSLACSWVIELP
jgi:hypothetical protein